MLDYQQLLDKVKKIEKNEKLDLSSGEDLAIGVMNLIAIEEHMFYTANKTNDAKYYDILNEVREMRKKLMKRVVRENEGELWCTSKHLLSASMRLMEVGTKILGKGEKKEAADFFNKSYQLYNLFWGLNLGAAKTGSIKTEDLSKILITDEHKEKFIVKEKMSILDKLGVIVEKVINCCKE